MIHAHDDQTIIAQCTPCGAGALALIRLAGLDALTVADKISKLASTSQKITNVATHTINFGHVVGKNKAIIDQVLFLVMHGPKTFTGQDTVEITCHNNQFIIDAIIQEAIKNGARLAQAGEFTKQAFLNKKIDLTQAEAINELICAHTQEALKKSLAQLEGSFSQWIDSIQKKLLHALSLCEASFEFLEEDINFDSHIKKIIDKVLQEIEKSQTQYGHQKQIKDGVRVALIGTVNAGKSSLFNTLVQHDRAIVTEIAGTTRDVIETGVYEQGTYITFVDTAGLRQTKDRIESEGIKRSFAEAEKADIILLLFDGSRNIDDKELEVYQKLYTQYTNKIISLSTKSDTQKKNNITREKQKQIFKDILPISIVSGHHLEELKKNIFEKIHELFKYGTMPFLINKRQHLLLCNVQQALIDLKKNMHGPLEHEIVAIHLKDSLEKLTELTGKTISELSLDSIFKNFCVGK